MTRMVGIFLYDEVEVLDFAGPFEVFNTANRLYLRAHPGADLPFRVLTIARAAQPVRARGGLDVQAGATIHDHPQIDVLIVPGGVHTREMGRAETIEWIARVAQRAEIVASVCTGAFLLAQAGLLRGKPATTHWEDIPDLRAQFPEIDVRSSVRWVESGQVISSAGISAGIDMALHLVSRLAGQHLAERTARQIEFDWQAVEDQV
jgi:transcriptional regulator GlxA family with amidase domain